jgi:hypothetical protein
MFPFSSIGFLFHIRSPDGTAGYTVVGTQDNQNVRAPISNNKFEVLINLNFCSYLSKKLKIEAKFS